MFKKSNKKQCSEDIRQDREEKKEILLTQGAITQCFQNQWNI